MSSCLTVKYVGISPPLKYMVKMYSTIKPRLPARSSREKL